MLLRRKDTHFEGADIIPLPEKYKEDCDLDFEPKARHIYNLLRERSRKLLSTQDKTEHPANYLQVLAHLKSLLRFSCHSVTHPAASRKQFLGKTCPVPTCKQGNVYGLALPISMLLSDRDTRLQRRDHQAPHVRCALEPGALWNEKLQVLERIILCHMRKDCNIKIIVTSQWTAPFDIIELGINDMKKHIQVFQYQGGLTRDESPSGSVV
ncbi:hypothetical protein CALCODRAFT_484234 [Calocera cornea HHB12733]|uniref:Uncharacterized protein n=1 Tax=Calocera cornea HHB12733 TaxID=1353952 RepID=A0A165F3I0_9BASI|nr:hypothetical protein CALCODRAFT_484234 [Calocera cornea HHB12733]